MNELTTLLDKLERAHNMLRDTNAPPYDWTEVRLTQGELLAIIKALQAMSAIRTLVK